MRFADVQVELFGRMRERLEQAALLENEMRAGLRTGNAARIEQATSRLETVALEVRLLADELARLPRDENGVSPELRQARADLDLAATRLARSSAVGGGLLERLIGLTQKLTSAIDADSETYECSGVVRERPVRGVRLEESA